jgi:hypothetical protein
VIECQPSSFSRGSYLNVGVTWLWKRKEDVDLGFDFGGRVSMPAGGGFIAYESDEQFEPLARKFAMAAAERMLRQRELVPTVDAATTVLKKSQGDDDPPNLLESIDSGIALGLSETPLRRGRCSRARSASTSPARTWSGGPRSTTFGTDGPSP